MRRAQGWRKDCGASPGGSAAVGRLVILARVATAETSRLMCTYNRALAFRSSYGTRVYMVAANSRAWNSSDAYAKNSERSPSKTPFWNAQTARLTRSVGSSSSWPTDSSLATSFAMEARDWRRARTSCWLES